MKIQVKVIILFVLAAQVTIIGYLTYKLITYNQNIRGVFTFNSLKSSDFERNLKSELKYFYEPRPDTVQSENTLDSPPNTVQYIINSSGENDNHTHTIIKTAGTYRIITIGDSFTFGQFVETAKNYPHQLEQLLNTNLQCDNIKKFEVINLGVPGYDIQYSVERYRLRGSPYHPDLVLWFLKDDDVQLINERILPIEIKYKSTLTPEDITSYRKKGIYYPDWWLAEIDFQKSTNEKTLLSTQLSYLVELNNFYQGPLLIFTFPVTQTKYKELFQHYTASRHGIFFFDGITNIYRSSNLHFPDAHPTEQGYKLIVNDVFNYIEANKIIACN